MRHPRTWQTPPELIPLVNLLGRVPTVKGPGWGPDGPIPGGYFADGRWWIVFQIKIDDQMAWSVVRRLAEVFNDMSGSPGGDRFPTVFMPVVPETIFMPVVREQAPLALPSIWWSLESTRAGFAIGDVVNRMMTRLPQPIEDVSLWS
jgi:hypothetical protein